MTIGAVVQARMTSKRFPGKVLADLGGKPVLEHVLTRVKMIPFVDTVICAFPADEKSTPIYEVAQKCGAWCSSGPEKDVLARYLGAAEQYGLDVIVRITADCPFIDPLVCGEVIALLHAFQFDYASNCFPKRSYPMGLDCQAFTFDCLEAAHIEAKKPYDREHVCPWMERTKGIHRGCVSQREDHSKTNLCVDYPADIDRLIPMVADSYRLMESKPYQERLKTINEMVLHGKAN